jgi:predicted CXXCH cytochrome family protein
MPTPTPTPAVVRASLIITSDAPAAGRHRVDPGAILTVALDADVVDAASDARLVAVIPPGWAVVDGGAGTTDALASTVTWALGDLDAGASPGRVVRLLAPSASPDGQPAFDATLEARLEHAGGTAATATAAVLVAPAIVVEHAVLARVAPVTYTAAYLPPDAALGGLKRFDAIRVRFQVRNADLVAVALTPRLQFADAGDGRFLEVPVGDTEDGVPFYLDAEWRPAGTGKGTKLGPAWEPIPVDALRVRDTDTLSQEPVAGERFMDEERDVRVVLPPDSYTEIEFAVRVSREIAPEELFQLRLTDAGQVLDRAVVATVGAGLTVTYPLSPGQQNGIPVGPPVDAEAAVASGVDFPLVTPNMIAAAWPESNATTRYRLAIAVPTTPNAQAALSAPFTSIHTPDVSLVSDTCATCHRTHVSQGGALLTRASPQSSVCFTCHDGVGSNLNTKAQYTDAAVPANDAATRSYYRHDATVTTTHTLAQDNEFGGVSNRHSECGDCHNPHNATDALSTQTTTGWTVAGQNTAISGVSVNIAAGSAPTYTLLDGTAGLQPDREHQVCLKCHSGFTTLNSNTGQPASRYVLDKAVELNPANASYHPVEAAGTNATTQMTWSLSNTSPFKQWNFTTGGTVRCVNCHGDPRKYSATTPPSAGSDLAPHTSQYRGILLQNYRDRVLKSPTEAYAAADFALCFVCHAEEPYRSSTPTNTVFGDHDLHISANAGEGPGGTSIDTPGEGGGNALCAECHFRIHGTALAYNAGDRSNSRLVNFSPNVTPFNGVLRFDAAAQSCTLVCHGKSHDNEGY